MTHSGYLTPLRSAQSKNSTTRLASKSLKVSRSDLPMVQTCILPFQETQVWTSQALTKTIPAAYEPAC